MLLGTNDAQNAVLRKILPCISAQITLKMRCIVTCIYGVMVCMMSITDAQLPSMIFLQTIFAHVLLKKQCKAPIMLTLLFIARIAVILKAQSPENGHQRAQFVL